MLEGYLEIDGKQIPRTLMGTSPSIGAAHFGHRARLYLLDLYRNPEAIAQIMARSYQMGVRGIQLIPHPPVVEALQIARDQGFPLDIIATIRPESENEDITLLSELDASAMLVDPEITDQRDWNLIGEKLDAIKDTGSVPGLITQYPFKTTMELLESPVINDFKLYMVPLNRLGYLMDCDTYSSDERAQFREIIKKMDKTIIAMHVLAAGIMTPDDAFDYLKTTDFVDMVAVGIASQKEAEESFSKLFER
ncbi:hypothetical protein [Methanobacterium formicicum]|uniref:Uncharacterized protein n=1 Tax=Methanobacterium formicicum (strain DSM 3637 / PP1) TaxID=1204725 RepID=K2R3K7_METFP|nr:hypothetical protein [Methanobacterium formicicum]EKF85787.1 hypothetical protein A994_06895 [Methanobacterium formicicum DSM 3637]